MITLPPVTFAYCPVQLRGGNESATKADVQNEFAVFGNSDDGQRHVAV